MEHFEATKFSDWEAKALKDLKTDEAYQKLYTDWNGIPLKPYYDQSSVPSTVAAFYDHFSEDGEPGISAHSWYNTVRIPVTSAKEGNAEALKALMNGAEGIHFLLESTCDATALLQDIQPEYIFLVFSIPDESMADNIRTWLDELDTDREKINLYISLDTGTANLQHYIELFKEWSGVRFLHFHLDQDRNRPVSDLSELLKQISSTFEKLTSSGTTPTEIARELAISVNIGPKFFHEIVRLRALRILVYKLCSAWGAEPDPENFLIHAISEPWIREDFQPQGNLIKSATAGMAGILGGADILTVMPEDPGNELQRRIARNVSIILKEETYLDKTRDPIAGSYYIETLTDELGRKVWEEFQKIA